MKRTRRSFCGHARKSVWWDVQFPQRTLETLCIDTSLLRWIWDLRHRAREIKMTTDPVLIGTKSIRRNTTTDILHLLNRDNTLRITRFRQITYASNIFEWDTYYVISTIRLRTVLWLDDRRHFYWFHSSLRRSTSSNLISLIRDTAHKKYHDRHIWWNENLEKKKQTSFQQT